MKKLILKSVLFLSLTIALVSCNKDDAPAAEVSLVGKWEYSKQTDENTGALVDYTHTAGCSKDYVQISATNFTDVYFETAPGGPACEQFTYTDTYTKSGNTITIVEGGFTYTATITVLTATDLTIVDVDGDITTYKRI